jgi:hypothetical protein
VVSIYLRDIQNQAFGTGQVRFNGGTLNLDTTLASLDDIKTAFKWVPKGTVIIDAVTEKIKPSDLAKIETTAVRRLTITDPVDFVTPGDLVEELTIPAGLTFETADPLPSLKSLTVLGDLTDDDATLANVENLTVAGEGALSAAKATYVKVTELTVSSVFEVTVGLNALTTLTVEAGGDFTGTSVGGAEGITLAVEKGGAATIPAITKLKPSVITGSLTSTGGFTRFDDTASADTPLTAADGAVINGIPFTAETKVAALAEDTVTAKDFDVPASKALSIDADKTLIIEAGSTFTYDGQVSLGVAGKLVLVTASGTSAAEIVGTGAITAGQTVISGGWEATGTGAGTVEIAGTANGATITGALLATGLKANAAGATITQNAIEDNVLLLTSANLDLSEFGSLTLKGNSTPANAGKLSLAGSATAGKITTGSGTGGSAFTATLTTVGGSSITDLTIGTSASNITLVMSAPDADVVSHLGSITAGHTTGPDIKPAGATDVTFVKDVGVAGTS